MAMQLLGKEVNEKLNARIIADCEALKAQGINPTLAIVRCGERPDDLSYEKGATKRAETLGVAVVNYVLPEDVTKEDLLKTIDEINANDGIHGVLMFRPLPKHLKADQDEICNRLDPPRLGVGEASTSPTPPTKGSFCSSQFCFLYSSSICFLTAIASFLLYLSPIKRFNAS